MRSPTYISLAWRLSLLGLVQVVLLAALIYMVDATLRPKPAMFPLAAKYVAARIETMLDRPDELRAELTTLRNRNRLEVALYRRDGALAESNAVGGQMPPSVPLIDSPDKSWRAMPLRDGAFTLVLRFDPPLGFPLGPFGSMFVGGLFVVGIGSLYTARWLVRPLQHLAQTARALGAGDLRARANLSNRDELGDVGASFDEMAERLQALRRAEKELLMNVSHELRTPVARIRVALEIGAEGDAARAQRSLGQIYVDLVELEALIDDILTTTRLDLHDDQSRASSMALRLERVAAETIVHDAVTRFRAVYPTRPLDLLTEGPLPYLDVDQVIFRRVIDNLLENAHKYSPDPSAPITLRAEAVDESIRLR